MTLFRTSAFALMLTTTAAFAQSAPPAAPAANPPAGQSAPAAAAPAPAGQADASDLTKDGKPKMKAVRAQCRDEIKGQNLKGDARNQAMTDCIIKQRPDMAEVVKCRRDPSLKGLDKDARKAAVQACVAKTKG